MKFTSTLLTSSLLALFGGSTGTNAALHPNNVPIQPQRPGWTMNTVYDANSL